MKMVFNNSSYAKWLATCGYAICERWHLSYHCKLR